MTVLHYLASPYSSPHAFVREQPRRAACVKAAQLIAQGVAVVSPIAHNTALITEAGGAHGWEAWQQLDLALLKACDKVLVLRLPGWEHSKGVQAELDAAQRLGKPVEYV